MHNEKLITLTRKIRELRQRRDEIVDEIRTLNDEVFALDPPSKIETEDGTAMFQTYRTARIREPEMVPNWFQKSVPDLKRIGDELKDGGDVPGAELAVQKRIIFRQKEDAQ